MKLVLYDVDSCGEYEFEDGYVLSIECVDKNYFNRLITGLKSFNDNKIAVFNGLDRIDFVRDCLVVIDYFSLEQYEKSILTKLYKMLEKTYSNEPSVINNMQEIYSSMANIIRTVSDGTMLDLTFEMPTSLTDYFKFSTVKPDGSFEYGAIGLSNLLSSISTLSLYKLVVLVNSKSFYSEVDLNEVAKTCVYSGLKVLLLDNVITNSRLQNEIKIVVDEDYFDVTYKE